MAKFRRTIKEAPKPHRPVEPRIQTAEGWYRSSLRKYGKALRPTVSQ